MIHLWGKVGENGGEVCMSVYLITPTTGLIDRII